MNTDKPEVELIIRGEPWGIQLDVKLFPLQCPMCDYSFTDLFEHQGSKYGHVGEILCKCGEHLNLTDSDNIVEYIEIHYKYGKRTIDFKELYNLTSEDFKILKDKYDYDIFKEHLHDRISLGRLVEEIGGRTDLIFKSTDTNFLLPNSVKKWKSLIDKI